MAIKSTANSSLGDGENLNEATPISIITHSSGMSSHIKKKQNFTIMPIDAIALY